MTGKGSFVCFDDFAPPKEQWWSWRGVPVSPDDLHDLVVSIILADGSSSTAPSSRDTLDGARRGATVSPRAPLPATNSDRDCFFRELSEWLFHSLPNNAREAILVTLADPASDRLRVVVTENTRRDGPGLPWEYLAHPSYPGRFLCLDEGVSIVRLSNSQFGDGGPARIRPPEVDRLAVFLVGAFPEEREAPKALRPVINRVISKLPTEAWLGADVRPEIGRPAIALETMARTVAATRPSVLWLLAHGNAGSVTLSRTNGAMAWVDGTEFGLRMRGDYVKVIALAACEGGSTGTVRGERTSFAGCVSTASQAPWVVACRVKLTVSALDLFYGAFFEGPSGSLGDIEGATLRGRVVLRNHNDWSFGSMVCYVATADQGPHRLAAGEPDGPEVSVKQRGLRRVVHQLRAAYESPQLLGLRSADARFLGVRLRDIYVPPSFRLRGSEIGTPSVEIGVILNYGLKVVHVVGPAGSGKSFLCQYVLLAMLDAVGAGGPVPLLLRVRAQRATSISATLSEHVSMLTGEFIPKNEIEDELSAGTTLIVDGLDEVPDRADLDDMVRQLHVLLDRYPSTVVLVTSRPNNAGMISGPGSEVFDIEPLTTDQAATLSAVWRKHLEPLSVGAGAAVGEPSPQGYAVATGSPLLITLEALFPAAGDDVAPRASSLERSIRTLVIEWSRRSGHVWRTPDPVRALQVLAHSLQCRADVVQARIVDNRRTATERRRAGEVGSLSEHAAIARRLELAKQSAPVRTDFEEACSILDRFCRDRGPLWPSGSDVLTELLQHSGVVVPTPEGGVEFVHRLMQEACCAMEIRDGGRGQMIAAIAGRNIGELATRQLSYWQEVRLLVLEFTCKEGWLMEAIGAPLRDYDRLTVFQLADRGATVGDRLFSEALRGFCRDAGFDARTRLRLTEEAACLARLRLRGGRWSTIMDATFLACLRDEPTAIRYQVLGIAPSTVVADALAHRRDPRPLAFACLDQGPPHGDYLAISDATIVAWSRERPVGFLDHDRIADALLLQRGGRRELAAFLLLSLNLGDWLGQDRLLRGRTRLWTCRTATVARPALDGWLYHSWRRHGGCSLAAALRWAGNSKVAQAKAMLIWVGGLLRPQPGRIWDRLLSAEHAAGLLGALNLSYATLAPVTPSRGWMSPDGPDVVRCVFALLFANLVGYWPEDEGGSNIMAYMPTDSYAAWLTRVIRNMRSGSTEQCVEVVDLPDDLRAELSEELITALRFATPTSARKTRPQPVDGS